MIKAAIFDFDGLLVDTEILSLKIYQNILAEYQIPFSRQEYSQNYSGCTEVQNIRRLLQTYALPLSSEECLDRVLFEEKTLIGQGVKLKEGAKELISWLKKHDVKIALATSSTRERALSILERHGILDYFDAFVFSEDVTHGKPNPEVFLAACTKLVVKPEDALVFEDSENGIQAALNAGIPVVCVPDMKMPSNFHLSKCEAVLSTLNEAIEILESPALKKLDALDCK